MIKVNPFLASTKKYPRGKHFFKAEYRRKINIDTGCAHLTFPSQPSGRQYSKKLSLGKMDLEFLLHVVPRAPILMPCRQPLALKSLELEFWSRLECLRTRPL